MALVASLGTERGDSLSQITVLVLTKYGRLGASSRLRSMQYVPWLVQAGLKITVQALLSDENLSARYKQDTYSIRSLLKAYVRRVRTLMTRRQFDVVWIEKEALPWWPLWLELALLRGVPYVLDYDDAIFHNYDQHPSAWVRGVFGRRIDGLMANATLVVSGNSYLAQRARAAGASWVEVVPTAIDLERYPTPKDPLAVRVETPRIVWIGSPSTARYLQEIRMALQGLAKRMPYILRVIGGGVVDLPGVKVEMIDWAEATEVESIRACQVGIMPLTDSLWERGKCGYKLIQYMACGLPVVASDVGVNSEIVRHGENGFVANTTDEWIDSLSQLLSSPDLITRMGMAGQEGVEDRYCIQKTGPQILQLLQTAAGKHS